MRYKLNIISMYRKIINVNNNEIQVKYKKYKNVNIKFKI